MNETDMTIDHLLTFGSLSPGLPESVQQKNIADLEQRMLAWVGEESEHVTQLAGYKIWDAKLQAAAEAAQSILDTFNDRAEPLDSDFSIRHKAVLVKQRQLGLLAEAQLQVYEGTLNDADLQRLKQALEAVADVERQPDTVLLELCIAEGDSTITLSGVLIVTSGQADKEPALLFVPGLGGGLQKFESVQALKERVRLTLRSGLQTPLWRHVPAFSRPRAMAGELQLVTRAITGAPIGHGIQTQLKWLDSDVHYARAGERFFDEAQSLADTLVRLHREVADNMAVPINEVRDHVIDRIAEQQRTAELAATLPRWLVDAPLDARQEYVRQLRAFRSAAVLLEAHLEQVLPPLERFVAAQLSARIKQDLRLDIDAGELVIDLPKRVFEVINNKPQFGSTWHSWAWRSSAERVQQRLPALACYNFDADDKEMAASLSFAIIAYPPEPNMPGLHSITWQYLHKLIPEVDVTEQYRRLLRTVFQVRSTLPGADNELKLRPYELELQLIGFAARHRRLVSETAYELLTQAARARATAELNSADIYMNRVVFKPGESVSGERSSRTLQGLSVIHDKARGKVLVYLPQVPDGNCLIEADSLEGARDRLLSSLNQFPARIGWLVSRIDETADEDADERYVNEALRRGFSGFISFVPALDLLITEQQLNSREWLLYQSTLEKARTNRELTHQRSRRQGMVHLMYLRAMLSFIPGLGAVFSVQDGWNDGHAAADAFKQGKVDDGVLLAGSTLMSVVDVLLSVLPGVGAVSAMVRVARKAARLRQAARPLMILPPVARKRYAIKSFSGYETDISLVGAEPVTGRGAGVWLKDGEMFIYRQDKAYRVYQRSGEETLRLKKTAAQGYEPPLRQVGGQWVYHTDVGLKGGMRSWIAEDIIVKATATAGFTHKNARVVLNQFDFPPDRQLRMELDIAEYYRKNKKTPDWAEQYRRPDPDDAVASTSHSLPGPSQTAADSESWKSWGMFLPQSTPLDTISSKPPIYKLAGEPRLDVIRVDVAYFEILPNGPSSFGQDILLRNNRVPCRSFEELSDILGRNIHDQPMLAKYDLTLSQWRVRGPLFDKKIEAIIEATRPGFTPITQRVLAEKLYDMAQPGPPGVTSTRLLTMNAVLKAWGRGGPVPVARLNDPLLMLEAATPSPYGFHGRMRWNLSYESALQPFQRLDFHVKDAFLVQSLVELAVEAPTSGVQHLRALMGRTLTQNGYEVINNNLSWRHRAFLVFRRTGRDELYVLNMRRSKDNHVLISESETIGQQWNSSLWFDALDRTYPGLPIMTRLREARDNHKLVTLLGGVSYTSQARGGTQVYILRLPDMTAG